MLVMNWMSARLVSVEPRATLGEALQLAKDYQVKRLVVLQDGELVGVVTDRDLGRADASAVQPPPAEELERLRREVKVADIMSPRPITVHVHDTLEEAALIMLERRVGGLPVVDDQGRVLAVITQSDVFRALISLTGVARGGVQFSLEMEDQPGSLRKAADAIRSHGGRIVAILQSYDRVAPGWRRVFMRAKNLRREELPAVKRDLEALGHLRYLVDTTQHTREILEGG
jgi:acetoin utilization protein AcuB